jgi:hypothetical protein
VGTYRGVHVQIHIGRRQTFVAVIARTTSGARRRDHLLYRTAVDVPDVESVAAILRAAAHELQQAADRL